MLTTEKVGRLVTSIYSPRKSSSGRFSVSTIVGFCLVTFILVLLLDVYVFNGVACTESIYFTMLLKVGL